MPNPVDARIRKIFKKFKFYDGFLSYQKDRTTNLANPEAIFALFWSAPKKPTWDFLFQFLAYF